MLRMPSEHLLKQHRHRKRLHCLPRWYIHLWKDWLLQCECLRHQDRAPPSGALNPVWSFGNNPYNVERTNELSFFCDYCGSLKLKLILLKFIAAHKCPYLFHPSPVDIRYPLVVVRIRFKSSFLRSFASGSPYFYLKSLYGNKHATY